MRMLLMMLTGRPSFGCGRPRFPPRPLTRTTIFWLGTSLQSVHVNATAGQSTHFSNLGEGVGCFLSNYSSQSVSVDATPGKSWWELADAGRFVSRQFPEEVNCVIQQKCSVLRGAECLKADWLVRSKPACLLLKLVCSVLPLCPWASEQVSARFWNTFASSWPANGLVRGGGGTQRRVELN